MVISAKIGKILCKFVYSFAQITKMQNNLAIVIPAYKSAFFRQTLTSLAEQSDLGFNVYIGDDCSPDDLGSIAEDFRSRLNLHYVRFDENLGGKDLVAHWQRCMELVGTEDFVCLFSDDDIMEKDCVLDFHQCLKRNPSHDVYHFNINIMDVDGNIKTVARPFPEVLPAGEFFKRLYSGKLDARMPEFIFRLSSLKEKGFVRFDLAFRTDNATVMEIAGQKGICSVSGNSRVLWRDSGINISSSMDTSLVERMVHANFKFAEWTESFFSKAGMRYPLCYRRHLKLYLMELVKLYPVRTERELYGYLDNVHFISQSVMNRLSAGLYLKKMLRRKDRILKRKSEHWQEKTSGKNLF